mmetsp:Transcript_18401/g.46079  ORF Transcript_18401/g.46079 Transcript_18401/m.46079 type:complete len:213 (-) Transcript_18401:681-1319(-)
MDHLHHSDYLPLLDRYDCVGLVRADAKQLSRGLHQDGHARQRAGRRHRRRHLAHAQRLLAGVQLRGDRREPRPTACARRPRAEEDRHLRSLWRQVCRGPADGRGRYELDHHGARERRPRHRADALMLRPPLDRRFVSSVGAERRQRQQVPINERDPEQRAVRRHHQQFHPSGRRVPMFRAEGVRDRVQRPRGREWRRSVQLARLCQECNLHR